MVTTMIVAFAIFAGLFANTSYQISYASLIELDDSKCLMFCPNIEDSLNYEYNFNQDNECGNTQVDPNSDVFPEQFGNSTESNEKIKCSNTANP